jgi:hypothetical protein
LGPFASFAGSIPRIFLGALGVLGGSNESTWQSSRRSRITT